MVSGGELYESLQKYEQDNYYLKDEQGNRLEPEKIGAGWERLGAQDLKITEEVYKDLKDGKDPKTHEQLVRAGFKVSIGQATTRHFLLIRVSLSMRIRARRR